MVNIPADMNRSAMASPMPEAPPVMIAILFDCAVASMLI
jgi:hypothetical protein